MAQPASAILGFGRNRGALLACEADRVATRGASPWLRGSAPRLCLYVLCWMTAKKRSHFGSTREGFSFCPQHRLKIPFRVGKQLHSLFGTDDPQETVDEGRIRLRCQAKVLVSVLFLNEHPALSVWDRF
jgi:hypothetical protein